MSWRPEVDKLLSLVAVTALGGVVLGVTRIIIFRRYGGWKQWLALLVAAGVVAVLTRLSIHDTSLSETQQAAIIGVTAFLAEDILIGIVALARSFSIDPVGTVRTVWDAIRGRDAKPIIFPPTKPSEGEDMKGHE